MMQNEEHLSDEKLWSWIDRDAPELEEYLSRNPEERERVKAVRASIKGVVRETSIPIPERVGEYAVKGLLGEGGMGLVLEAEQENPRRPVAVKILRAHLASDPSSVARFRREAEVLGKLSHPGIARIYDAGKTEQGRHFLVMELIRGKSLQKYVLDENPSRSERLRLFAEIAEAVHAAHEEGIIHRDLKPTNVLLDSRGRPTVVDFGLAGVSQVDLLVSSVTEHGKLVGTPQFMSPEQIRGESDRIDRRTDVYGLGVVLFQLLTGELPYDLRGKPITEVARVIYEEAPLRPDSLDPSLRGDLTTIVLKALEKDPERRYDTAGEMVEDVRRFLERRPILARPPSPAYRLRKFISRHRIAVLAVLTILALQLGALGVWNALRVVEPGSFLPAEAIQRDLDAFQEGLEARFAYLKVARVEYRRAIQNIGGNVSSIRTRGEFALELTKVLAMFVDAHARVSGLEFPERYLPFLIEPCGDRFVAFNADRSQLLDAHFPYVERIDQVDISSWLDAALRIVPRGSPQYRLRHGLRFLRYLGFCRRELGHGLRKSLDVELASEDGARSRTLTLDVSAKLPIYGLWPRVDRFPGLSAVLDGNTGYLRLPRMNETAVELIRRSMLKFRTTEGLIIDVRGNGGGTREPLRELFPYFMRPDDPPRVVNVAAYRLFQGFREDHLAARFSFRETSTRWSNAERETIRRFKTTFRPEWTPPRDEFSEWHYMVISRTEGDHRFFYSRPVVVLMDLKCQSSTDIFLGALKGWRNVTLVGTASAGGSARLQPFTLEHSRLQVAIASMASFQPNGHLYDTHGIHPDVIVDPVPEYFIRGGRDVFLEKALELLKSADR